MEKKCRFLVKRGVQNNRNCVSCGLIDDRDVAAPFRLLVLFEVDIEKPKN